MLNLIKSRNHRILQELWTREMLILCEGTLTDLQKQKTACSVIKEWSGISLKTELFDWPNIVLILIWSSGWVFCSHFVLWFIMSVREQCKWKVTSFFFLVLTTCYVGIFPLLITSEKAKMVFFMAFEFLKSLSRPFLRALLQDFIQNVNQTNTWSKVFRWCPDALRQNLLPQSCIGVLSLLSISVLCCIYKLWQFETVLIFFRHCVSVM